MNELANPRAKKTYLKPDEKEFLRQYALSNRVKENAEKCFTSVTDPLSKAQRLLTKDYAQAFVQEQREHISRQLEHEFNFKSSQLLNLLAAQAVGAKATKKIVKKGSNQQVGEYEETQEHFDQLEAINQVMKITGRHKGDNITMIQSQQQAQKQELSDEMKDFVKGVERLK